MFEGPVLPGGEPQPFKEQGAAAARAVPLTSLFQSAPEGPALDWLLAEAEARGRAEGAGEAEARLMARLDADEQALAAAQADHARALAAMEEAHQAATMALATALDAALSDSLALLGIAVARAVLAAEPATGPETLSALLADVLGQLPEGAAGTLFVSPCMVQRAGAMRPAGWRVATDPALGPGAVRADVDAASFASSLASRLAQLEARLQDAPPPEDRLEDCA